MGQIDNLQDKIGSQLLSAGANILGYGRIPELKSPDGVKMTSVISLGIAYDPIIVSSLDTDIAAFEDHLTATKKVMGSLLEQCEKSIEQAGFATWTPPISKNLPGLLGDFSHKTAATSAGLGWVGKNALFISKEFGCGVRLATVITDAPLNPGKPVTESQCGKCKECIEACPYGAIIGTPWSSGIAREELFDAFLCNEKREEYIPTLGYKHPCGLCIQACPFTRNYGKKRAGR